MLAARPPVGPDRVRRRARRRVLGVCADQFALMIENARLTGRVVEQEKLRRDLALAAEVQKRLLPDRSAGARRGGAGRGESSRPDDRRRLLRFPPDRRPPDRHRARRRLGQRCRGGADHVFVQASLAHPVVGRRSPLPDLAAKMNRFLHHSTTSNKYATFFYAQIDESGRRLRYVNAGHRRPTSCARHPRSRSWRLAAPSSGSFLR